MQLATHSDAELIRLAQSGASPAFAVLVYRHAAEVREVVADDRDPIGATIATFVKAMRQLPKRTPEDPVRPWLLGLAAKHTRRPVDVNGRDVPVLDPDEADEIWAELDLRWPKGRVPRTMPRWIGWLGLVVALVALAVIVPYLVLTVGNDGDTDDAQSEVVGRPYEAPDVEREPAPILGEQEHGGFGDTDGEGQI